MAGADGAVELFTSGEPSGVVHLHLFAGDREGASPKLDIPVLQARSGGDGSAGNVGWATRMGCAGGLFGSRSCGFFGGSACGFPGRSLSRADRCNQQRCHQKVMRSPHCLSPDSNGIYSANAITSISTSTSFGRRETSTVERAGGLALKYFP